MIFHIKEKTIYFYNGGDTIEICSATPLQPNNQEYHLDKYGLEMSPTDIQNYSAHIFVWEYIFRNKITQPCIIIENDLKLTSSYEEICSEINTIESEWDLLIPYNKVNQEPSSRNEIFPSRLGYYWGSYFYVINAQNIKKVLSLSNIKQPVDEEILEVSFDNKLKTILIDTDWFEINEENCPIYKARSAFFLEKIQNIDLWEAAHKEQAISITLYLSQIAQKLNLSLFAHAGTLLGIVRHNDIMPWDDDIDFCMDENEIQTLLDAVEQDNKIKYTKRNWHKTGSVYYKFYFENGEQKEGYDYTFPFVDIWLLFNQGENSYITSDGYEAAKNDYFPGKKYDFFGAQILLPENDLSILYKMYKNWDKYIKVFSWSHRQKENCIDSIIAPIKTDSKGRLISEY